MSGRRPPKRSLSADDQAVWDKVSRQFKPLDRSKAPLRSSPKRSEPDEQTRPAPLKSAHKASLAAQTPPPVTKTPVDRSSERKVRRGHLEVEGRIDLHGMTRASARRALIGFLKRAHRDHKRVVLVITGKGASKRAMDERRFEPWSEDTAPLPGVLRRSFREWMLEPEIAQMVSGYSSAHHRHGGAGAFYVMLRA